MGDQDGLSEVEPDQESLMTAALDVVRKDRRDCSLSLHFDTAGVVFERGHDLRPAMFDRRPASPRRSRSPLDVSSKNERHDGDSKESSSHILRIRPRS